MRRHQVRTYAGRYNSYAGLYHFVKRRIDQTERLEFV